MLPPVTLAMAEDGGNEVLVPILQPISPQGPHIWLPSSFAAAQLGRAFLLISLGKPGPKARFGPPSVLNTLESLPQGPLGPLFLWEQVGLSQRRGQRVELAGVLAPWRIGT